jgi:hypothetical protein
LSDEAKPTAPHVLVALGNINEEIEAIGKDRKNEQQRYNFRGIDQMYNALHRLFAKNRVLMKPRVIERTERETQTKSGTAQLHVVEQIEYDFVSCVDGSTFTVGPVYAEGLDMSDKASNKCMSAAQKYALIQTFLIPTEDVVDADSDTLERGSAQQAPQQRTQQEQPRGNFQGWNKFKNSNEPPNGDQEHQQQAEGAANPDGVTLAVPQSAVPAVPPDMLPLSRHFTEKPFVQQSDVELSHTIGALERLISKVRYDQNRVALATVAAVARHQLQSRGAA